MVVALSDTDPGDAVNVTDITTSIAARVKNDSSGFTMGYAGRESVASGRGTKGSTINTTSFSDANVRAENYLLSRRLFLQTLDMGQLTALALGCVLNNRPKLGAPMNERRNSQDLFYCVLDLTALLAALNQ